MREGGTITSCSIQRPRLLPACKSFISLVTHSFSFKCFSFLFFRSRGGQGGRPRTRKSQSVSQSTHSLLHFVSLFLQTYAASLIIHPSLLASSIIRPWAPDRVRVVVVVVSILRRAYCQQSTDRPTDAAVASDPLTTTESSAFEQKSLWRENIRFNEWMCVTYD